MFIPDSETWFLPIPDPKTATTKNSCHTFFWTHNFHKIENYVTFEMLKIKFGPIFKNCRTFYLKICHLALKNMSLGSGIRDQGSGIRKKPIPDPGSRGQKGTGSRISDPGSPTLVERLTGWKIDCLMPQDGDEYSSRTPSPRTAATRLLTAGRAVVAAGLRYKEPAFLSNIREAFLVFRSFFNPLFGRLVGFLV